MRRDIWLIWRRNVNGLRWSTSFGSNNDRNWETLAMADKMWKKSGVQTWYEDNHILRYAVNGGTSRIGWRDVTTTRCDRNIWPQYCAGVGSDVTIQPIMLSQSSRSRSMTINHTYLPVTAVGALYRRRVAPPDRPPSDDKSVVLFLLSSL